MESADEASHTAAEPHQLSQPATVLTEIVLSLLVNQPEAAAILSTVATRLSLEPQQVLQGLGLYQGAPKTPLQQTAMREALAKWHDEAVQMKRLKILSAAGKLRRSSISSSLNSTPEVTRVVSFAERDAELRRGALSIKSSITSPISSRASMASLSKAVDSPFMTAEEMPSELADHKEAQTIRSLLASRPDRTLTRWRRRSLYTEENWREWAEWQPSTNTHRDANECGRVFSNPKSILIAINLRSSVAEIAADAWNTYRRTLLVHIRQALTVGFPWAEILVRLAATYSDPTDGYPRLANYVTVALEDATLLAYPLLHVDVLIYNLDVSYACGSGKCSNDSMTAEWDRTQSRQAGEDPISLAVRVINAHLRKHENVALNDTNVWDNPSYVHEINKRYLDCLWNDESDPERGRRSCFVFEKAWNERKAFVSARRMPAARLSCEAIAREEIVPNEAAHSNLANLAAIDEDGSPSHHHSGQTGAGCRRRRAADRARAQHLQLPHTAYRPDSIEE